MKEIIIKAIKFTNFKGLRNLSINFPARDIDISGENGLGKSSIMDGFTWVLFGKDRKDRKQFGIKTLDKNNEVIPRLPHEVEITLSVNGEEVRLIRRYSEKWVRPKGAQEEEFKGHEETRLYNDIPCSVTEWNTKIADLCSEEVFKFITNPLYFSSQKQEVQREMLIRMAGGVSDAEIAAGNPDFTALLMALTGKSLEEYKREIGAKKKRIKKEIEEIPGAIKENRLRIFEPENWQELEQERDRLTEQRADIIRQIADSSASVEAHNKSRLAIIAEINKLKTAITNREFEIGEDCKRAYRLELSKHRDYMDVYTDRKHRLRKLTEERDRHIQEAEQCTQHRESLISTLRKVQREGQELAAKFNTPDVQFTDSDFRCPTCGHQYDIDRIEEIQANALREHQARISRLLNENAESIKEIKRLGVANNEKKEQALGLISTLEKQISDLSIQIKEVEGDPKFTAPAEPDWNSIIPEKVATDPTILQTKEQINTLSLQLEAEPEMADTCNLQAQADAISDQIMDIAVRLSKRKDKEENEARIAQLEEALRNGNNEISQLEGIEYTIQAFTKARIEAVETKINNLFTLVRFKMFAKQINGQEIETCEATVDGVPFSDLNDAGRLNAGLDIINAICKFEDTYAPIFIDNAEGVNHPLKTTSQRIRLIVSKSPELIIEPSENTPSLF